MPVKALMEVSSGLAWATQQDPEKTQILRPIEQRAAVGVGGVMTTQGRQESVGQRVAWWPWSSCIFIFAPNSPGVPEAERAFRSLVNEQLVDSELLSCHFLCFPDVWCLLLLSAPTQQRLLRYRRDIPLLLFATAKGEAQPSDTEEGYDRSQLWGVPMLGCLLSTSPQGDGRHGSALS